MNDVLVIGGSGMLSGLSKQLQSLGANVTVYSRTEAKMISNKVSCHWIQGDYQGLDFIGALTSYIESHDVTDLVIWMHSTGARQLNWLLEYLQGHNIRVHHIKGRSGKNDFEERDAYNLDYHLYVLGYGNEAHSRWLSNEEISRGVFQGMVSGEPYVEVGFTGEK